MCSIPTRENEIVSLSWVSPLNTKVVQNPGESAALKWFNWNGTLGFQISSAYPVMRVYSVKLKNCKKIIDKFIIKVNSFILYPTFIRISEGTQIVVQFPNFRDIALLHVSHLFIFNYNLKYYVRKLIYIIYFKKIFTSDTDIHILFEKKKWNNQR